MPSTPSTNTAPTDPASAAHLAPESAVHIAPRMNARPEPELPRELVARLLAIAAEYQTWGRVDDEMRWAPYLCRMPMPASAHLSKSQHTGTHGRKLYSLFARDRNAYLAVTGDQPAGLGQVIVKESWLPEKVASEDVPPRMFTEPVAPIEGSANAPPNPPVNAPPGDADDLFANTGDHFHPFARDQDGTFFRAARRGPLFIMVKAGEDHDPNTDQGWIYGTVTADGKEVTSAGLVRSCMGCHAKAPHGRLFGLGYSGESP